MKIVPGIHGPLPDQIPALAPPTALVPGERISTPAMVEIREAGSEPRSPDPQFYRYWVGGNAPAVDVRSVCAEWEGAGTHDGEGPDK